MGGIISNVIDIENIVQKNNYITTSNVISIGFITSAPPVGVGIGYFIIGDNFVVAPSVPLGDGIGYWVIGNDFTIVNNPDGLVTIDGDTFYTSNGDVFVTL